LFCFVELLIPASSTELRLHARRDWHDFIDFHVFFRRIERVARGGELLSRLEHCFGTQGRPGVVAGEQGLQFADDLLGDFWDQVAFNLDVNLWVVMF